MSKEGLFRLYNLYFRKYWIKVTFMLIILLIGTVVSMYQYIVNQHLIDTVIASRDFSMLPSFFCLFLFVSIICIFLSWAVERCNIVVSQQCGIDMRIDLLKKVHLAKFSDINKLSSSAISTRIMEDVTYVNNFFNNVLIGNASLIFTLICLSAYLCTYSIVFFLMVLLPSLLQMLITRLFSSKIRENQNDARVVTQDHLKMLTRNMICLPLVKAFSIQGQLINDYYNCLKQIRRISVRNFDVEYISRLAVSLIGILGDVSLLYVGARKVMNDSLSLGAFVAIIGVASSLRSIFTQIVSVNIQLEKVKVSAQRIIDILDLESDVIKGELNNPHKIEKITFDNVSFSFSGEDRKILKDFNMTFTNKLPYIIKGTSGKGKSTILNLISQNLEASLGNIYANDTYSFKENDMRKKVAVCYQEDIFAFDTIYDNLTRSDDGDVIEGNINEALDIAEALGFVSRLKKGLNTKIEEVVCNFSGGEIKRLSIARTLLKQADVYIFDESFSCIDEETRLRIFEKILNKLKGKIIIVISHDDSIEQYFNVKTVFI